MKQNKQQNPTLISKVKNDGFVKSVFRNIITAHDEDSLVSRDVANILGRKDLTSKFTKAHENNGVILTMTDKSGKKYEIEKL